MSTPLASLAGLFEKAIVAVDHEKLALVFAGLAGWLRVRGAHREELRFAGARMSSDIESMKQWLHPTEVNAGIKPRKPEVPRTGENHLRRMWKATEECYTILVAQSLNPWAEEMADILRRGLAEHLHAIDALAGLAGRLKERP